MSRVPSSPFSFGDSLEGLGTQLIVVVFMTNVVKLHSQIIRGKGIKGIQVHASLCSVSSMRGHTQHILSPGNENGVTSVQWFCPGKPFRDSMPKGFMGASHRGNLCLAHTKIQTPRREIGVPHKPHCLYKESGHSDRRFLESKFPNASLGPVLQVAPF